MGSGASWASAVVAPGLQRAGSVVVARGLTCSVPKISLQLHNVPESYWGEFVPRATPQLGVHPESAGPPASVPRPGLLPASGDAVAGRGRTTHIPREAGACLPTLEGVFNPVSTF